MDISYYGDGCGGRKVCRKRNYHRSLGDYGDNSSRSTIVISPGTFWTWSRATGLWGSGRDDRAAEA